MSLAPPTPDEIRAFRKAMGGVSQATFADYLGASTRAVEEWEAGRREPPAMLGLAMTALADSLSPWDGSRAIVHRFQAWDQRAGDMVDGPTWRRGEWIASISGARPVPSTAHVVDPAVLDPEGRFAPAQFAGWASERAANFERLTRAANNFQIRSDSYHFRLDAAGLERGVFEWRRDEQTKKLAMHYFGREVVLETAENGDQSFDMNSIDAIVRAAYGALWA